MTCARSLSPSRAGDFQACPLLYRFRVIDRLPEPPDAVMVRGTLVHAVLEDLFGEDARSYGRARPRAGAQEWEKLRDEHPRSPSSSPPSRPPTKRPGWRRASSCSHVLRHGGSELGRAGGARAAARLHPRVRCHARRGRRPRRRRTRWPHQSGGLQVRAVANPRFEARALFQMRFYALVIWRTRGVIPTVLQLLYLSDRTAWTTHPPSRSCWPPSASSSPLGRDHRAIEAGEFLPRPSLMCQWCSHRDICPEWGGTPPPMPAVTLVPADWVDETSEEVAEPVRP